MIVRRTLIEPPRAPTPFSATAAIHTAMRTTLTCGTGKQ
jgi:hypothetical protein